VTVDAFAATMVIPPCSSSGDAETLAEAVKGLLAEAEALRQSTQRFQL